MRVPPEDHPKFAELSLRRNEEAALLLAPQREAEPHPPGWHIIFIVLLGIVIITVGWIVTA